MYSEELIEKGAEYMLTRNPEILKTQERAEAVLRDLCRRAKKGGYASTAGFSVTFRDEGGMGVVELSEHVVDIYDVPEDDDCRGFEWRALDSLNEV